MSSGGYAGFGFAAVGSSLAGYGSITSAEVKDSKMLVDSQTNTQSNARKIDVLTRDYVLSTNGKVAGMDKISQQVYLAIATNLNSSCLKNFGLAFNQLQTLDEYTAQTVVDMVNVALNPLISQKTIEIQSIKVGRDPDFNRLVVNINWINLSNNTVQNTRV